MRGRYYALVKLYDFVCCVVSVRTLIMDVGSPRGEHMYMYVRVYIHVCMYICLHIHSTT